MILSGTIEVEGNEEPARLRSRLMARLEGERCEVVPESGARDGRLRVELPTIEGTLVPAMEHHPMVRFFRDSMEVSVTSAGVAYRLVYWGWSQVLLHGMITTIFALEWCFGGVDWLSHEFWLQLGLANALPFMAWWLLARQASLRLLRSVVQEPRSRVRVAS